MCIVFSLSGSGWIGSRVNLLDRFHLCNGKQFMAYFVLLSPTTEMKLSYT